MKNYWIIVFIAILWSCEETDILNPTGKLEVTDFHLPTFDNQNFSYEAWLLVDGSYVSVGKINNDSILAGHARFQNIDAEDLAKAQSFAITVESDGLLSPSNFVLLVGDFVGSTAELSTDAQTQNGVESLARKISASYTIQNASIPDSVATNYGTNGLWFFKGIGDNKESTLHLNYEGIHYRAWLKKNYQNVDRMINMGRIISDTLKDDKNSYTLFPNDVPKFSGEDFLIAPENSDYPEGFFPVDVRGKSIYITPIFENYYEENLVPILLLEGTIPEDAPKDPNIVYDLKINTSYSAKAFKQ